MQSSLIPTRQPLAETLSQLPPEWPDDPLPAIRRDSAGATLLVLDDDPTGTQSVHGIPVLTEWRVETLQAELANDLPAFYVLTNSRALPMQQAQALNAKIGCNVMAALSRLNESAKG